MRDLGAVLQSTDRRADARATFLEAAEMDERATVVETTSVWTAIEAAGRLCDFGVYLETEGDLPTAITWFGKAAKMLEDARRREPANVTGRKFLTITYWNRARVLVNTGRNKDAVLDWRRVTELAEGPMRLEAYIESTNSYVRLGDIAAAVQDIEAALLLKPDAATRFKLALIVAHAAANAEESDEADAYAARAVAILSEMRSEPILSQPESLKTMTTHADFAPLRNREDFRALLAELQAVKSPKK